MQNSIHTKDEKQSRLSNPILDLAIAGVELQLKAWQAYQIESAHFVAKRLRANLAYLQSLGHGDGASAVRESQRIWLADYRKDYAEELGRLVGTSFALGLTDLAGLGRIMARPAPQTQTQPFEARPPTTPQRQRPDLAA